MTHTVTYDSISMLKYMLVIFFSPGADCYVLPPTSPPLLLHTSNNNNEDAATTEAVS